jgi:predicted metalloprotease
VLGLVLGSVVLIALAGRATRPIAGTAMAIAGARGTGVGSPPVISPSQTPRVHSALAAGAGPLLHDGTSLLPVTCELPELSRSSPRLRRFYEATLRCLDAAWRPAREAVDAAFQPAGLDLASDAASGCGDMPDEQDATAFYCGEDEVIYMPSDRLLEYVGLNTSAHLAVLGHEYGHHVQNLVGILDATAATLVDVQPGSPRDLEITRRIELQANCFAGMFLSSIAGRGSVTQSRAEAAVRDFGNTVGSQTHGTVENQLRWARTGFVADETAACDTWNAPATRVG